MEVLLLAFLGLVGHPKYSKIISVCKNLSIFLLLHQILNSTYKAYFYIVENFIKIDLTGIEKKRTE